MLSVNSMELRVVDIGEPGCEVIIGQGNFTIKTIEDLYDAVYSSAPGVKFGAAMNEAKPKVVRVTGNDEELKKRAAEIALKIGAGHVFVVCMKNAFPNHVLNRIKQLPTVACIYAATSNPIQIIVAETELGRAVLGVVDGTAADHVESVEEKKERKELVRRFGYFGD